MSSDITSEAAPALGDPVAPKRRRSAPKTKPAPIASPAGEGERGESGDGAVPKHRRGVIGEGQDAAEMAQKRWAAARQTQDEQTEAQTLRSALLEQVSIATSRTKGTTPAARTAAAALIPRLQEALRDAEEREQASERIDWSALPMASLTLLQLVLEAEESDVVAWLALVEEERNAGAHARGQESGAPPPP